MLTPRLSKLDKNFIINGAFDLFQRNFTTTSNLTTSFQYLNADRYRTRFTGSTVVTPTIQRSTSVPANTMAFASNEVLIRRNASAVTIEKAQRIESNFSRELSNDTVSFSASVLTETATQVKLRLLTPTAQDNYTASSEVYSSTIIITPSLTWQEVKFENITLGSVNNGLEVELTYLVPTGTDGANTTHRFTLWKLSRGSKAQQFSLAGRTFQEEIELCQRYYEKSYNLNVNPGTVLSDTTSPIGSITSGTNSGGDGGIQISVPFKVSKFSSTPICITYSPITGAPNTIRNENANSDLAATVFATNSYALRITSAATPGDNANYNAMFIADSEI